MEKLQKLEEKVKELSINQIILVGVIFLLAGAFTNNWALTTNEGRMPVLTDYYRDSNTHFDYQNISEINDHQFSDKYKLPIPNGFIMYSLGDVLIVLGGLIATFGLLYFVYFKIKLFTTKRLYAKPINCFKQAIT